MARSDANGGRDEANGRPPTSPLVIEAERALAESEFEAAELAVREQLRAEPEDPAALRILATIAARFGAVPEAERILRRVVALAPGYLQAWVDLASILRVAGRLDEALALMDRIVGRHPDEDAPRAVRVRMLMEARRYVDAEAGFHDLLARNPASADRWMNYGFLLRTLGRQGEAIAAYRHSLALDPGSGAAWLGLANFKTVRLDDGDIEQMLAAAGQVRNPAERLQLHFALGQALDGQRRYAEAFAHYAEANRLRRIELQYDPALIAADVDRSRKTFTAGFYERRKDCGAPQGDPIFIVGMPRSGSTLVEQILSSHASIEGTEELFDMLRIVERLGGAKGRGPHWQDNVPDLSCAELNALGQSYLAATRRHRRTDRPFFTDKLPGNWAHAGLIRAILPNAKIIDVRRHPMACGFANFTQFFTAGITFSYDLADIGRHYREYVRIMDHFDAAMPGRVHRIHHEDLIEDLEGEVRRLLDYLELPFDPACLRFHETERAVLTPSSEQVRRPINRDGMERWRNYEPWLGPLKEALGPVLDCYPAAPGDWPG